MSTGTVDEATDSAHSGRAPSHLSGSLAAALATRLDPHHPVAEVALHSSVELEHRGVRSAAVPTVPVSDDVFHGHSLSRRRPATGASVLAGGGRRGDRKGSSLPRAGRSSLRVPGGPVVTLRIKGGSVSERPRERQSGSPPRDEGEDRGNGILRFVRVAMHDGAPDQRPDDRSGDDVGGEVRSIVDARECNSARQGISDRRHDPTPGACGKNGICWKASSIRAPASCRALSR